MDRQDFSRKSVRAIFAPVLVGLLLTSCSDSSGPSVSSVAGAWGYSATRLSGANGLSCNITGATLNLIQAGATFSGTYSGGSISCTGDGGFSYNPQTNLFGSIVSGVVSGTNVSFNFDTSDFSNSGTLSGSSIAGTTVLLLVTGSSRVTLTGVFGAARR